MGVTQLNEFAVAKAVDQAGLLKAKIAGLEAELNEILTALKLEGDGEYVGKKFKVVVSTYEKAGLDSKVVKGLLTPAQLVEATKVSVVTTAAVKAQ